MVAAVAGSDYLTNAFQNWKITNGYLTPTSTTMGIIVNASSTIGNGTGAGGLTVSGNATTTGVLTVGGNILASAGDTFNIGTSGNTNRYAFVFADNFGSGSYGSGLTLSTAAAAPIKFQVNVAEVGRFDSTGNFGIGTTSPLARLSVSNYGGTIPQFIVSSSTGSGATTTALIVDRYGNVGINQNNPQFTLDVNGTANVANLLLDASSTLQNFTFVNATGTNATTTNLAVTGTASTTSLYISGTGAGSLNCLQIDVTGKVTSTGSACGSAGVGSSQFSTSTNGLAIYPTTATATVFGASATTTTGAKVEVQGGLYVSASTTLQNLTFVNATGTNATTTNNLNVGNILTVSGAGTSTFAGGLQTPVINVNGGQPSTFSAPIIVPNLIVNSTLATSTFANGIQLNGGCYLYNGNCLGDTSSTITRWDKLADPQNDLLLNMGTHITDFNWSTGSGASDLFTLSTNISDNGTGALLSLNVGAGSTIMPLHAFVGSTEALAVDSTGRVGIGTTGPTNKLSVVGNSDFSGFLTVGGLGTFNGILSYASSTIGDSTQGGGLTVNGQATTTNLLVLASTTLQNFTGVNSTTTNATSTSFAISSISSGNLLKTTTGGAVVAAVAGSDYLTNAFQNWKITNGYLTPTSTTMGIIG